MIEGRRRAGHESRGCRAAHRPSPRALRGRCCASIPRMSSSRYALISSRIGCAGGRLCRRQMRRSLGSARRSSRPRFSSRSTSRATVIGSTSQIAASSLCESAGPTPHPRKNLPLRARHAARARALVEIRPHDARDVVDEYHRVSIERIGHCLPTSFAAVRGSPGVLSADPAASLIISFVMISE